MTADDLRQPSIEGSSVPEGSDEAQRYARRCEQMHYADQRKMMNAQVRLSALAEICSAAFYPVMSAALAEIAEDLK